MIGRILDFFGGGLGGKIALVMIGVIAVMAGGIAYLFHDLGELKVAYGKLEGQKDQAIAQAADNAALIKTVETIGLRNVAAVGLVLEDTKRRNAQVSSIIREVNRVRPEDARPDGCPVVPAPILRALDGVRDQRAHDADKGAGQPNSGP